jgi:hypothetical protein
VPSAWTKAVEVRPGARPAEQVADDLGLEGAAKDSSRASWHEQDSLGASIHIVQVSPKGRSSINCNGLYTISVNFESGSIYCCHYDANSSACNTFTCKGWYNTSSVLDMVGSPPNGSPTYSNIVSTSGDNSFTDFASHKLNGVPNPARWTWNPKENSGISASYF